MFIKFRRAVPCLLILTLVGCGNTPDRAARKSETESTDKDNTDIKRLEASIAKLNDRLDALENRQAKRDRAIRPAAGDTDLPLRQKDMPAPHHGAQSNHLPDVGGNYFRDGKRLPDMTCKIIQDGNRLIVVNEKQEAASASFDSDWSHIIVPSWDMRGFLVGGQIYWSKGDGDSGNPIHRWVP